MVCFLPTIISYVCVPCLSEGSLYVYNMRNCKEPSHVISAYHNPITALSAQNTVKVCIIFSLSPSLSLSLSYSFFYSFFIFSIVQNCS